MTIADVVKVTQYLTRAEDIPAYGKVRSRFLGISRPASMLLVIPQLVRPSSWSKSKSSPPRRRPAVPTKGACGHQAATARLVILRLQICGEINPRNENMPKRRGI